MNSNKNLFRGILLTTSLICIGAAAYMVNGTFKTADSIERQIASASVQLQDLKGNEEASQKEAEKQSDIYTEAENKAKQIADLQSRFYTVMDLPLDEDGNNTAYNQIASELKKFYVSETYDAPNPWFYGDLSKLNPNGWKFVSSWTVDENSLPVAWYLTSRETGGVLAVAFADFNTQELLFENLRYGITPEGGPYNAGDPVESNPTGEDKKSADDLLSDIDNADVESEPAEYLPEDNLSAREDLYDKWLAENPDIAEMYGIGGD